MALLNPEPTLDDLCAALARLEYMLDRAELGELEDLHCRCCATKDKVRRDALAALVGSYIKAKKARLRKRWGAKAGSAG